MSIQQAEAMLLNSTAGPLPTGATGTRFPLTGGSSRCIQEADFNQIFDVDPAILGCVNTVFRCRQRNCGALRRSASDRQILEWREILEWRDWQKAVGHGWNRDANRHGAPPGALLNPSLRGDVDFRRIGAENAC